MGAGGAYSGYREVAASDKVLGPSNERWAFYMISKPLRRGPASITDKVSQSHSSRSTTCKTHGEASPSGIAESRRVAQV